MPFDLLLYAMVLAVSWTAVAAVRAYAVRRNLLDIPNERSSHKQPTPRGGGLGLAIAAMAGCVFLAAAGRLAPWTSAGFLGGSILTVLIGFIDDHRPVSSRTRFLVHMLAACWAVWCLGLPACWFGTSPSSALAVVLMAASVFTIVWLINLTNFMDGIDGLAGAECLFGATGASLALGAAGQPGPSQLAGCVSAASAGFLWWNWPPARIFMGDVGSGFLGFSLGFLMIAGGLFVYMAMLILLGVFLIDATYTLLHRLFSGQRWTESHNNHAYQHAARHWTHRPVTLAVSIINVLWLAPLAWLSGRLDARGAGLVLLAWLPLAYLARRNHAGQPAAPQLKD